MFVKAHYHSHKTYEQPHMNVFMKAIYQMYKSNHDTNLTLCVITLNKSNIQEDPLALVNDGSSLKLA